MAVGVVTGDSIFQPKNICHAETFAEHLRVILFCETRISLLHLALQALFRGEKRSAAVHVDAATFQHHPPAFVFRLPYAPLQFLIYFRDSDRVPFVIRIFCPAVESEMVVCVLAVFVSHAMGPESRIHPRSVGTRKKSTASRLAPDFFKMVRTRDSDARFSTSRKTRSTFDKCRTISANAHGMGANFPGQSVSSWGQPSQVASWRSHSAGMRKPTAYGVFVCGSVFIGKKNLTQRSRRTQRSQRSQRRKGRIV